VFGGLHRHWAAQPTTAVPVVLLLGAAEEVIFRGVGQHLLTHVFGWPAAAAIALMALVYGLNHLYFGWLTVGQKAVTGLLFGALYQACGQAVLVPVLAHLTQNLVVLLVLPIVTSAERGARGRP
jgi:membrane protease YdiL (CAAX protease family)